MNSFTIDKMTKTQINNIIEFTKLNIYSFDDLLDMRNAQMAVPGSNPEHLVRLTNGNCVCYFLVKHTNKGICHYFSIKPNVRNIFPSKSEIDLILSEFGLKRNPEKEKIINDPVFEETNIIIPVL